MVKYLTCSKCGNRAVEMPITEPYPVCWNCTDEIGQEDFDKLNLETLFFQCSSIQKMGKNRFIIDIPKGLNANIEMMSEKLRTGKWLVHLKSKYGA